MDFFENQWSTYKTIVQHDFMHHRALVGAVEQVLKHYCDGAPAGHRPHFVDLGCGDADPLAAVLRDLPLGSLLGLDQASSVLPLAAQALGEVPYPCDWIQGELLEWATAATPHTNPVDILYSSFAIHHLDGESQEAFLAGVRKKINPKGMFLWADIFREPGESVDDFRLRYTQRMSDHWGGALQPQQLAEACFHVSHYDLPADRATIGTTALKQGWALSWIWAGPDQAEALAVLTPA
ncbi:class I SAM-dependent methyltransferase [Cyanobium sp. T1B-Tous]|uniref:class I SAM-dependent methyltransferase n=1 Tax=Cyanobium sp. T1B-Tous TaxID=2823721 RepID=UPI0020CFA8B7|nr:class I SAM-dependent methyltransferase [Cyanobium sp. T1B-Tous]MCP9805500.1 class I SAM-dependent methyltransferase [Cyanobium sp. T1B-Tous]